MKQLVQLRDELSETMKKCKANVMVIFREEESGQEGLKKVVEKTKVNFLLALDTPVKETSSYSPGERIHDSYIIDKSGIIKSILKGTRYERAKALEFKVELEKIAKTNKKL